MEPEVLTPATLSPVGVHTPRPAGSDHLMAMSAVNVKARVQAVQSVMASVMREETHYGVIPGTKKPSLYKPGAEVLCMTFGLSARISTRITGDHPDIAYHWKDRKKEWVDGPRGRYQEWVEEEGETLGYFEVIAVCEVYSPDGRLLASCEGSCNNREKKYRTLNVYETRNTVMKMAGKRAYVAAVLMATGASDMFTQDLEDMEEGHGAPGATVDKGTSQKKEPIKENGWLSAAQSKLLFAKGKAGGYSEEIIKHVQHTLNDMGKQKGKPYFDAIADGRPDAVKIWEKAKESLAASQASEGAQDGQQSSPDPEGPTGAPAGAQGAE